MTQVDHRIRQWREARGLTQAELGELVGIHQNGIGRLEAGRTELKIQHIQTYARALNVRPIDILPAYVEETMDQSVPHGSYPTDITPYTDDTPLIAAAIETIKDANAWTMQTRALESEGILKGDILISSADTNPKTGSLVIAKQVGADGKAIYARLLNAPYLVAASDHPSMRMPMLLDSMRLRIIGKIETVIRLSPAK